MGSASAIQSEVSLTQSKVRGMVVDNSNSDPYYFSINSCLSHNAKLYIAHPSFNTDDDTTSRSRIALIMTG